MRRMQMIGALILAAAAMGTRPAAQTNLQAVKDHPMVSRFQGTEVLEYKQSEFDEYVLPLGPITGTGKAFEKSQRLEGKVTHFKYNTPANRSSLEVVRSYQAALERGGFQILYKCDDKACISAKFVPNYTTVPSGLWCYSCEEPMRYIAAKLTRKEGDVYVTVVVEKDRSEGGTWLNVVEVKPMETGLVKVNAEAMRVDIAAAGHTPIYGVFFDTGKTMIKPESDATLAEIAKLLKANPTMKLHVVGHTDNVGTSTANMELSRLRAAAVVTALVTKYQIPAARLDLAGV